MNQATQRHPLERPSNFDKACRMLGDVLRQLPDANYLWTNGRWQPATIDDIMIRANERLKAAGGEQFKGKSTWLV